MNEEKEFLYAELHPFLLSCLRGFHGLALFLDSQFIVPRAFDI